MKKKIAYFTPDCFLDTDLTVLPKLALSFDIDWTVLFTYTPEFYKYSPQEVIAFAAQHNIKLNIYKRKYRLRNVLNLILLIKMVTHMRRIKPDMIYFTAEDDLYFSLVATLFLPVSKSVKGVHNAIPHEGYDTFLKKFTHNHMRRHFKYFHFFSTLQAEYFKEKFKVSDYFTTKLSLVQEGPPEPYMDKEKAVTSFLFFGKVTYYKGVDLLIEAVNRLSEETSNFKVLIAGRCENWEEYDSLIKSRKNLELNIQMIPGTLLKEYLSQYHFTLLPYRSVTQSGVMSICYNSYIPAIASDIDGFKEYVTPGVNGMTFKTGDVNSLYQAMKDAIEMPVEQYNSMRRNLKLFTESELDRDMIANKYKTFFLSVMDRK